MDEELFGGVRPPLGRQGGKFRLYKTIIDNFPDDYEKMTYVEAFFGGGSVFFNKEPSVKEVINDLDTNVTSFIKAIKNNSKELERRVNGEYNRTDFHQIVDSHPTTEMGKVTKFFLRQRLSYLSMGGTFDSSTGGIRHIDTDFSGYAERLKHTVILNKDYMKVIKEYDSSTTFFYLDPPYENSSRDISAYKDINLEELRDTMKQIKGKFLMSLNNSHNIRHIFKDFYLSKVKTKYSLRPLRSKVIYELLISNYKR